MGKYLPILLLSLLPALASADVTPSGPILVDTTWSPEHGVYYINSDFTIFPGATLTIEPGTIVKSFATSVGGPTIYGNLIAQGTEENPIYFTSLYDDSVGGDTDGGGPSVPGPASWQGLYFKGGSSGRLEHIVLRYSGYGGFGYGNYVGVENDGGDVVISNSHFSENYANLFDWSIGYYKYGFGVWNKSGRLVVENSIFNDHVVGIYSEGGEISIKNSEIKNSFGRALHLMESNIVLENNSFTGNLKLPLIVSPIEFIHENNEGNDLEGSGFSISGDWGNLNPLHSRDLELFVNDGSVVVPAGETLNVEPGTVFRLGSPSGTGAFYVHGALIARGETEKKIYFISSKVEPTVQDWEAIFFEQGSSGVLDHVVVKNAGKGNSIPGVIAAIYQRGENLEIKNSYIGGNYASGIFQNTGVTNITDSELSSQSIGIWAKGGEVTVSNSSLHDNRDLAILNESSSTIDARHNWWGAESGPNVIDNPTPTGTGDRIYGDILYQPFLTQVPGGTPAKKPVIIIPGIMGSAYKNDKLVIDPILHTYDDLIATLVANGYVQGKDLFDFPYEWRNSNVVSAELLKAKIAVVQAICDCEKVDLVAHSMGGLVARQYIQSKGYTNNVDHLIFLGTPHKGAQEDYLTWEGGFFPPDIISILIESYFRVEALKNGYITLFDYVRNRPVISVKELLPVFDYLKDKDGGTLRTYPAGYPRNVFLENLNNNISTLLASGVKIANIFGDTNEPNTINQIRVVPSDTNKLWEHGIPDGFNALLGDRGLERGAGDDTVTLQGATINQFSNEGITASHQRIPTVAANRVIKILTGKDSLVTTDSGFNLSPKVLVMQLLSPVDMLVTAPDGKRLGKNFQTGEEYEEIPLAFYSGYRTDEEYLTILNPLDGEYKVELQGTGDGGEYTLITSYLSEEVHSSVEFSAVTGAGQITELATKVDNNTPQELKITLSGDPSTNDLVTYINIMSQIGWITDAKITEKLIKWAESIIRFEVVPGKADIKGMVIDKKLATMLENELSKLQEKGQITQSAYNFLKLYIGVLLNN